MGETAHVFISYVREDSAPVDRLKRTLEGAGVPAWLDRDALAPGERISSAIRNAIERGRLFLACFSEHWQLRDRSYMNEELLIAIGELRRRATTVPWLVPIKLSPCAIPPLDIGMRETLRDLHYLELYRDWDGEVERLLALIQAAPVRPRLPAAAPEVSAGPVQHVTIGNLQATTVLITQGPTGPITQDVNRRQVSAPGAADTGHRAKAEDDADDSWRGRR